MMKVVEDIIRRELQIAKIVPEQNEALKIYELQKAAVSATGKFSENVERSIESLRPLKFSVDLHEKIKSALDSGHKKALEAAASRLGGENALNAGFKKALQATERYSDFKRALEGVTARNIATLNSSAITAHQQLKSAIDRQATEAMSGVNSKAMRSFTDLLQKTAATSSANGYKGFREAFSGNLSTVLEAAASQQKFAAIADGHLRYGPIVRFQEQMDSVFKQSALFREMEEDSEMTEAACQEESEMPESCPEDDLQPKVSPQLANTAELIPQKTTPKRIYAAPGAHCLRFFEFFYSPAKVEGVFKPIIADWQFEYFEALKQKDERKAAWISVRHRWGIIKAMGLSQAWDFVKGLFGLAKG